MPFKRFKRVLERPFRVFEEKLRLSILNSLKWQIELSPGICPLRPQRVIFASVSLFRLAWLHSPLSLPTEVVSHELQYVPSYAKMPSPVTLKTALLLPYSVL